MNALIKRYPLATFFVLAYALSWWGWVVGTLAPASQPYVPYPFFPAGPLLSALIVLAITAGRAGLRDWGASFLRWRVGWIWYAAALGIPLAVSLSAVALNVLSGAPARSLVQLQVSPWYVPILVVAGRLINPLEGPMGEEPGWRGFAQPRLQSGRSPLVAALIVGMLAAGWHLPLLPSVPSPIQLLAPVAFAVLAAWVYNRTGGSVLLAILLHAADGVIRMAALGYVGADAVRQVWLYAAMMWVAAISVVIFDRGAWRLSHRVAPAAG
jgi:membrane protease YdiL (CAAX protease family)